MPEIDVLAVAQTVVEPARRSDRAELVALMGMLFEQEVEFRPDPQAQSRGLDRILDHPDVGLILVARQGLKVVGMVNLLFTVSTALGERVALMEDLIVLPERRGAGVGSALVAGAVGHARRLGCRRLTLLTDAVNDGARHFYEEQGFTCSSMVPYRMSLSA